jgi:hypothetical protein
MEWNRSATLALSAEKCVHCRGGGLRPKERGDAAPCNCVLRSIFRICFERFVQCANKDLYQSRVSLENGATRDPNGNWSRKNEEYVADFELIVRHTLSAEEYKLYRYHFVLGADWKLCVRKLKVEKGLFFHCVYRIQQKLGRAFCETSPYPLYPVRDYFNLFTRDRKAALVPTIRPEGSGLHEVVPVRIAA